MIPILLLPCPFDMLTVNGAHTPIIVWMYSIDMQKY